MITLVDLKRRITPGVHLQCVENTKRPELNGTVRVVQRARGNSFTWRRPADAGNSWTYWPKARAIEFIDADTFRMPVVGPYGDADPEHTVTLRFIVAAKA